MSSSNLFGSYRSQTTYALQQISSSRYPDTNKDFERNIARLNQFVDYIASYLQTMQKGVDQANEDPITKLRSTVLDLGILLGGGELLYGINLGDLQYWLPALGAMFGFDSSQPLPLNLLYAAEHFFLGFIIPLDAWAPAVEDVIDGWAIAFGLPADFVASLHSLLDAIQSLTSDYLGLFNALWGILTIFNTLPGVDQGPFADLWGAVRTLLSGQGITALGSVVDPVFHSLAPWIEDLAILLNDWDTVVKAFTGGIYNAQSMVNLATMFASFTNMIPSGTFDPLTAWLGVFTGALTPAGVPGLDATKIVSGTFAAPLVQPLIDAISVGFGGSSGLNFTSLQSFIAAIPSAQATIDKIYDTLTSTSGTGHSLTDLAAALVAYPANFIAGVLTGANIPGLDATKIVSGTLAQARAMWAAPIDTLVQAWGGTGSSFTPTDLITFASAIPHDNLTGNLGGSNIANTINRFLDGGVQAIQNNPALSNQTIAQWSNALAGAMGFLGWNPAGATPLNSVADITSKTDATLKARAVQKDPNANIDRTMDATFDLKEVMTQSTLPTVAVTQGNPLSAPINIRDGGVKQTATFKGYLTGTLTKCYVNLYHVSPTTGTWTWFYSTADYHASIATGTTPQYNFIPIPAAQYVNTTAGDIIQAEIVVYGSGTLNIVGKTLSNQLLPMTGIFPGFPAAQRLATAPPTYITSQANMAFGNGGSGTVTIDQACSDTGALLMLRLYRTTNAGAGGVTIGGAGFTSISGGDNFYLQSGFQSFWLELFYCKNPPAGAQTLSAAGGTGVTNMNIALIQLANVGSIQGYVGANGTSANPSFTIGAGAGAPNSVNVVGFGHDAGSVTGTTGFNAGQSVFNGGSYEIALGLKDYSASAQTVGMTNASSGQWGALSCTVTGLALQPTTGYTVANPSAPGSTGVPAAYNRLQPWLGLSGAALVTSYSPVIDPYATPGSGISVQNPAVKYPWANNFDIVVCSDGSGGEGGGYPVGGVGGKAGTFTRQTLTRAQIGTSNLTMNIGGGSPGTGPGVGGSSAAGGVSVVVSGWGTVSQTGAPGSGSGLSPSAYGVAGDSSAGITYNDANGTPVTFGGGAGGAGGQAPGSQPGGGGSGGNATYMPNFNGGNGGAAEVWIRSYQ